MAQLTVVGATGGLGANVTAAALSAGHEVVALVRDAARARLAPGIRVIEGDATSPDDVARATAGSSVVFHCANPPFAGDWIDGQRRMITAALDAARRCDARLVFPGNVWTYGPRRPGERIDDDAPAAPTSQKGAARADIEAQIRASGGRWSILRVAEFYGPHVTTLLGPPLRALARGRTGVWFGPADVEVQLAFMPDIGRLFVAAATDPRTENRALNVPPGDIVTPRTFFALAQTLAGAGRVRFLPAAVVRLAAPFDARARAFADILHLWTAPAVMATEAWRSLGLPQPRGHAEGITETLTWLRATPGARMQVDARAR